MKILVTTGTTLFPQLILQALSLKAHSIILQTPSYAFEDTDIFSVYVPFFNDIDQIINDVDCIITHAGAGNVYRLLESEKRFIVCPNLYRTDIHQQQLANYIKENKYASVCYNLTELEMHVDKLFSIKFEPYSNEKFHGQSLIVDFLNI